MLTLQQARVARRHMHAHRSPDEIVAVFGGRYTYDEIVAAVRHLRAVQRQRYAQTYARRGWLELTRTIAVSHDALAERDQRLALMPRDLTALICGDPLPGYSALERRESGPQRRSDPLDALVFHRR